MGKAFLSVNEAADRLGVHPSRVYAMIRDGLLISSKIGGRWLVEPMSVERQKRASRPEGRPISPANAWSLLMMAEGRRPIGVNRSAAWRARKRLDRGDLISLAPQLRKRADVWRLRAHPGDLARLAEEDGIVRGGVSAARDVRADIVAPEVLELYAPLRLARRLNKKYALQSSDNPNVILRVVSSEWPFQQDSKVAPPRVVALDLLEADDERTRRAGRELLKRLDGR